MHLVRLSGAPITPRDPDNIAKQMPAVNAWGAIGGRQIRPDYYQ